MLGVSIQIGSPNLDPNITEGIQCWQPGHVSLSARVKASRQKAQTTSSISFSRTSWEGATHTSDNVINKICLKRAELPAFSLISNLVKLTTKVNHHLCTLQIIEKENISLKIDRECLIRLLKKVRPKRYKHKGCLIASVIRKKNEN